MVLEPPGLDPTIGAGRGDRRDRALQRPRGPDQDRHGRRGRRRCWPRPGPSTPDGKTYTFTLQQGRQVLRRRGRSTPSDGEVQLRARASADGSTNKAKKAVFDNISPRRRSHDPHTVILTLNNADATLPFRLGENTAVILHPNSAASAATQAGGHRARIVLDDWNKGSSVTLAKWDGYRDAARGASSKRVTFRFINDPAAQVAALLAGDIDGMPRFGALQALKQFQADKRFTVEIGSTAGKGILAINNQQEAVRRRARAPRASRTRSTARPSSTARRKAWASRSAATSRPPTLGYVDLTERYPLRPGEGQGAAEARPAWPRR
ncbi:MAG: ABC transporter substrate-binding protein [Comamonadaceae bacterium]|nr:ABC transporter substrate-binding protein [Comamonadaceae bacterium]